MPNENLTGALNASLRLIETESASENDGFSATDSPLREADPNAIDEMLDRINQCFAEGMPEKITDEKLHELVDLYRAEALRWQQEEQNKKPRARATKKPIIEALDLKF